jgi:hypothetical protein
MPIYKVRGPNKRIYEVEGPPGATDDQILAVLAEELANNPPEPKGGFGPALSASWNNLKADTAATLGKAGIIDPRAAEDYIGDQHARAQETFKPTDKGWNPFTGGAPVQKTAELLGGSLPYMAAPLAAGAAASMAAPAAVAGIAGLGATGLVSAGQFTGSNLSRQMGEGKSLEQTDAGAAVAAAIPQAALDVVGFRFIPGIRRIVGSAGKEITDQAAKAIATQTAKQAAVDYAKHTGMAVTAEGLTEAMQQYFERLQAGLDTMSPEARSEYIDNFVGGAVLGGTIAPAGRYFERGEIKQQAAAATNRDRAAESARIAQEQAAQDAAEAERRKTPAYLGELEQRWQAAQQKRAELQAAVQAVPKGEFQKEDAAEARAALSAFMTSPEWQETRKEYGAARGAIEQNKALRAQMAGQQDPLAGRPGESLPTDASAAVPIEAYAERLKANPAVAQAIIDGKVKIGALPPEQQKALVGALKLHFAEQKKAQAARDKEEVTSELAGRQADLQTAINPNVPATHDVSQFEDSTEQVEQQRADPNAEINWDFLDDIFGKALEGKTQPIETPDIKPLAGGRAEATRTQVEGMFDDVEKARRDYEVARAAGERERAAEALTRLSEARQKIDAYQQPASPITETRDAPDNVEGQREMLDKVAAEGPSYGQEATRRRLEQQKALDDMRQALDEIRTGAHLGGSGSDVADTTKEGLVHRAQRAKQAYIRSLLAEAALHRKADGQGMTQDEAIQIASEANDKLDEAINRTVAERSETAKTKMGARDYDREKVSPDGSLTRWFTLHDQKLTNGPVEVIVHRDPKGRVVRIPTFFKKTQARADMLQPGEHIGPETTDAELIQKKFLDTGMFTRGNEDRRPLAQRPFAKPEAALDTIREDVEQLRKKVAPPQRKPATKETPALKQQFADSEAKKTAEARGENTKTLEGELRRKTEHVSEKIDKALTDRKLSGGVRMSLSKAKRAFEDGKATRDLLDVADEMAERALRGERTRDPVVLRDFNEALSTADRAQRDSSQQRSLPGVEETSFERTTAERFVNSPQVKKAREAVDAMRKAVAEEEARAKAIKDGTFKPERQVAPVDQIRTLEEEVAARREQLLEQMRVQARNYQREENKRMHATVDWAVKRLKRELPRAQKLVDAAESELLHLQETLRFWKARRPHETAGIKHYTEAAAKQEGEVARLKDDVKKIEEAVTNLVARAVVRVEYADAMDAANSTRVLFERESLKFFERKLAALKEANAPKQSEWSQRVAAQRAELTRAEQFAERLRDAAIRARDERNRMLANRLGLPGMRMVNGEKEVILSAERAEREKALAEMKQQAETTVVTALRRAAGATDAPVRRATGPVTRAAQGTTGRLRTGAAVDEGGGASNYTGKGLSEATAPVVQDVPISAKEMRRANAVAAAIKTGEKSPEALRTRLLNLQNEFELMGEADDMPSGQEKRQAWLEKRDALMREMAEVDAELAPLETVEARDKRREDEMRAQRERKAKRDKKVTSIGKAVNVAAAAKKTISAAEDYTGPEEADTNAFGDLLEGNVDTDEGQGRRSDDAMLDQEARFEPRDHEDASAPYHGMTYPEATRWAAAQTTDPSQRFLFKHLEGIFENEDRPGQVRGMSDDTDFNGFHLGSVKTVWVRNDAKALDVMLHELVHAATVSVIDHNAPLKAEVTRLLNLASERGEDHYGLRNEYEFIAEAMSNPEFQLFLSQIPSTYEKGFVPRRSVVPSLWSRFVQAVARALGLTSKQSLLNDTIALTEQLFETHRKTEGAALKLGGEGQAAAKAPRDSIVGRAPGKWDNVTGNLFGLNGRVQLVDKLAAHEVAFLRGMKSGAIHEYEAMNANYFMRLAEQVTQAAGQFITHGPLGLAKQVIDGHTEYRYKADAGANLVNVAHHIDDMGKALGMDAKEAEEAATTLFAGERASAVPNGWKRLYASDPAKAQRLYTTFTAKLNASPEAKAAFEAARKEYKAYNKGLIDFAVKTGFLRQDTADYLNAQPYVPFYRIKDGEVSLMVENEKPIRIGNLKDHPDLAPMLGGEDEILPLLTSAVQNTFMLTRMALNNKAKIETMDTLKKLGFIHKMGNGVGPDGVNTVRYNMDGKPYFAHVDTDMYGIPAELLVRGLEGIKTTLPMLVRLLGLPANLIRKMVTRSPAYIVRQLLRDPINASIIAGVDGVPVFNALKQFAHMKAGRSNSEAELMRGLTISSNVWTGGEEDMTHFLERVRAGKTTWTKLMNKADTWALQADAATRATIYEDSLKKGLSERDAQFRALEYQNFSRRGLSPTMQMVSTMIPFFNAQVQGLDVLYRALRGTMPFTERLHLVQKLRTRAMMLGITAFAYALMMRDDEDYRKLRPEERYQNFFIRVPGVDDLVKIPIPYEAGILFKGIPEAILDAAFSDTKAADAAMGVAKMTWLSVPGFVPVAVRPVSEAMFNKNALLNPIESVREQQLPADQRYRDGTPEALKALGKLTGVSPLLMEHFVRGYTSQLGVHLLMLANPLVAGATGNEEGDKPSAKASSTPLIGGLFQREGRYIVDRAYDQWKDINEARKGYADLVARGKRAEAMEFAQRHADLLTMKDAAGLFRQELGQMSAQERAIRQHPTMPQERKDRMIEQLKKAQNQRSQKFYEAVERTKSQ